MAATLEQIRAAIVAKMETVDDIGRVHGFERYAREQKRFLELYKPELHDEIRGWFVRRVGTVGTSPALTRHSALHRWRISGFMSLDDERQSEVAFDTLIEALRAAFRADETLNGLIGGMSDGRVSGLQLDESQPVSFAGVLCHSARLTLYTRTHA